MKIKLVKKEAVLQKTVENAIQNYVNILDKGSFANTGQDVPMHMLSM